MSASPTDPPPFVTELRATFEQQVRRALDWQLDGSPTSLAVVDHYLASARLEEREPILSLLAAGAGAYFGEIVRNEVGAHWLASGRDGWRLRLLLRPQFVHFSPVCMAFEAIIGNTTTAGDLRLPTDVTYGANYQLPQGRIAGAVAPADKDDDGTWLANRLEELPAVPEDQFFSLTARYETLHVMLEFLAERHASDGHQPRDYVLQRLHRGALRIARDCASETHGRHVDPARYAWLVRPARPAWLDMRGSERPAQNARPRTPGPERPSQDARPSVPGSARPARHARLGMPGSVCPARHARLGVPGSVCLARCAWLATPALTR